ncbi:hypothetical protein [Phaffia rhodozyma]|uniref:Uncharacterized protein n=1 Tax=Phaffia rhodozyma TaxID=264483 RepID=A0A0F7SK78_PHARH|nr:hypothetical protein [Phaffia rhodozyma]
MCGTNIIVSSTDSDLEAFSHNPADDSFAPLPDRTGANTNYLNEQFLSSRSLLVGEQSNAYRILLRLKFRGTKGSIGHTFMVCIHTENQNQGDFYPFVLLEISVLDESPLGHLRYLLTDVPPQPNSPPDNVFNPDQPV